MHPDPGRLPIAQRAALAGGTLLLMAAAITSLGPLISGSGWWWLCAFIAAGVLAAGLGARAIGAPAGLVPVAQAAVLLMQLTLVFGGSSGFLLLVPTFETFGQFGGLLEGAGRTIQQQAPPAIAVPALLFALAVGTGALSIVADLAVQAGRMPALAAVPALVPVMIPGFIVADGAQPQNLLATAAAFLVLLRIDVRVRRRSRLAVGIEQDGPVIEGPQRVPIASSLAATVGVAVVGLVAASVLAAATPSISQSELFGKSGAGSLFSRGVSPFIDLGRDLRRPAPVPAFHYTSPDADRPYFRLLTIDRFRGEVWGASLEGVDSENTVDLLPHPVGLGDEIETAERTIDVTVDALSTNWLPAPYPTARVENLRGSWYWERSSLAIRSVDTGTEGQNYRVTRLDVDPTADQLREAAGPIPELIETRNLGLADDRPQVIRDTAAAVTAGAATKYDAAVAIQDWLRGEEFSYSTEAPVEQGYDGGGYDVVASFLEAKSGYCVHFAATMAVLAREIGIPSRISVGYTAGSSTDQRIDGRTVVRVDSHDLHAWPELYFAGVGWVAFEPTPGRGVVPSYTRPDTASTGAVPNVAPGTTGAVTGRPDLDPDRGLAAPGTTQASDPADLTVRIAGGAVLVVALLFVPAAARTLQRAGRRRRIRRGRSPAIAAWEEVLATSRDLGAGFAPALTPRAFAAALAGRPAFAEDAGGALSVLRDAVERERYGPEITPAAVPHPADQLLDALGEVRHALAADARPVDRVRAALLPASLLGAWSARITIGRPTSGA
ncbi:DUF3488 and transglutaminase-like domain-containing protein [Agromyces larvae]|uniref:DUF3488 and transglutaminase-like domain-containing protein n=1 Tax=Agromyces larvae TaxID=2929802 RepID=A0ABY4C1P6_9MICO|nr:DUF3488 and transglutaminase-like domain-containing protein [Agromyces larvae]UOE45398.1 DUF3488 and transglutaminase-like domain-containing protein [Agromyces larvae]